jgi:hypothetical protein
MAAICKLTSRLNEHHLDLKGGHDCLNSFNETENLDLSSVSDRNFAWSSIQHLMEICIETGLQVIPPTWKQSAHRQAENYMFVLSSVHLYDAESCAQLVYNSSFAEILH